MRCFYGDNSIKGHVQWMVLSAMVGGGTGVGLWRLAALSRNQSMACGLTLFATGCAARVVVVQKQKNGASQFRSICNKIVDNELAARFTGLDLDPTLLRGVSFDFSSNVDLARNLPDREDDPYLILSLNGNQRVLTAKDCGSVHIKNILDWELRNLQAGIGKSYDQASVQNRTDMAATIVKIVYPNAKVSSNPYLQEQRTRDGQFIPQNELDREMISIEGIMQDNEEQEAQQLRSVDQHWVAVEDVRRYGIMEALVRHDAFLMSHERSCNEFIGDLRTLNSPFCHAIAEVLSARQHELADVKFYWDEDLSEKELASGPSDPQNVYMYMQPEDGSQDMRIKVRGIALGDDFLELLDIQIRNWKRSHV